MAWSIRVFVSVAPNQTRSVACSFALGHSSSGSPTDRCTECVDLIIAFSTQLPRGRQNIHSAWLSSVLLPLTRIHAQLHVKHRFRCDKLTRPKARTNKCVCLYILRYTDTTAAHLSIRRYRSRKLWSEWLSFASMDSCLLFSLPARFFFHRCMYRLNFGGSSLARGSLNVLKWQFGKIAKFKVTFWVTGRGYTDVYRYRWVIEMVHISYNILRNCDWILHLPRKFSA